METVAVAWREHSGVLQRQTNWPEQGAPTAPSHVQSGLPAWQMESVAAQQVPATARLAGSRVWPAGQPTPIATAPALEPQHIALRGSSMSGRSAVRPQRASTGPLQ